MNAQDRMMQKKWGVFNHYLYYSEKGYRDIRGENADEIRKMIHKHIEESGVQSWFDGTYTLFNEASIIYRDGGILQTRRPDRVMIKPDGSAIVVDFKFGREKEDYMHQVQEYMDLLRKMGHPNVEGYIWYVYNNKIQTV